MRTAFGTKQAIGHRTADCTTGSEGTTYLTRISTPARCRFAYQILRQQTVGRNVKRAGGRTPFAFATGQGMDAAAKSDVPVDLTTARPGRPIARDCTKNQNQSLGAVWNDNNAKLGMGGDSAADRPDWSAFVTLKSAQADTLDLPMLISGRRRISSESRGPEVDSPDAGICKTTRQDKQTAP